jgi:mono/diheme cytochrome c family protein
LPVRQAQRWAVRVVLWTVALLVLTAVILIDQGHGLATRQLLAEFQPLRVRPDASQVARGRHLSEIRCAGCHAPDFAHLDDLSGGTENYLDPPGGPALGSLVAPNLTPAGTLGSATDEAIARAIRQGISVRGAPLLVMPSPGFRALSDSDLAALIAYLRTLAPVSRAAPPRQLNLLAWLVLGIHLTEDSVVAPVTWPVPDPPRDSSAVYGRYLVEYLGCRDCHGVTLRGGRRGQLAPPGSDLKAFAAAHDSSAFSRALRGGVGSAGIALDPRRMPWPEFARLTDEEVGAVRAFLLSNAN